MKNFSPLTAITLATATLFAGCAASVNAPPATTASSVSPSSNTATARLITADGKPAGQAQFYETNSGVEVVVTVEGLKPGQHGFHVHANGACSPGVDPATGQVVAFGAAGGHFDYGMSHNHGQPGSPAIVAHAGELPNINVDGSGNGTLRYLNPNLSLAPGKQSVIGRSLIVHAQADDFVTDPSGNSGARVVCGLIENTQPSVVVGRAIIDHPNAFPEGIAVDTKTGIAYVGSSSEGHIWKIAPGADKAEMLTLGGALGRQGAFGMKVDAMSRLWVAGGPQGNVAVLDTASGAILANLKSPPGVHTFLNDLVATADGSVYVTDSFRPVLFRARIENGVPVGLEPWLDLNATPIRYVPGQINLNGIVASPDGRWLLAIQLVTGQLWRIDTASKTVTEVQVDGGPLVHGDGLLLRGANELLVLRNEENELVRLRLAEGWSAANVVQRITDAKLKYPTTAATATGGILVVNAQLNKQKEPPPLLPFDIVKVTLP